MDDNYQKELEEKLAPLGYNELMDDYEARKRVDELRDLNTRLFAEIRKNYNLEQEIGRLELKINKLEQENRKLRKVIDRIVKDED